MFGAFGGSCALSGKYLVVGDTGLGKAYVYYQESPNQWSLVRHLNDPDPHDGDTFGWSVLMHDDLFVVSDSHEQIEVGGDAIEHAGAVYIFRRIGQFQWSAPEKITAELPSQNAAFGNSIAIMDDVLVVESIGSSRDKYTVHIFEIR